MDNGFSGSEETTTMRSMRFVSLALVAAALLTPGTLGDREL